MGKMLMGSALALSELYHFTIAGIPLKLYKRVGESYEHVLMKALGFAMFRLPYPTLEIERDIGWRYRPDLIALDEREQIAFWGECGQVSVRKIAWLAKHSRAPHIVLFKNGTNPTNFITQLQREIHARYRPASRLQLVSFRPEFIDEIREEIHTIPTDWYRLYEI
jgi:hypothetical protein